MSVLFLIALALFGLAAQTFDKWSSFWSFGASHINVLPVAVGTAVFFAFFAWALNLFKTDDETPGWVLTTLLVFGVVSALLGIWFTEPATQDAWASMKNHGYEYRTTRSGGTYYYYFGGSSSSSGSTSSTGSITTPKSTSSSSSKGMAYLAILLFLLILVVASAVIPHLWFVVGITILFLWFLLTCKEWARENQLDWGGAY